MYDVIIVGGGPAGLSAALVLGRCRRTVLLCDDGRPRNRSAYLVHGFFTRDGTPPMTLRGIGREQLSSYESVEVRDVRVTDVDQLADGSFQASMEDGYTAVARTILLATGVIDELPDLEGFEQFYGVSIHHCPYCDGWEEREKKLAVYGQSDSVCGLALDMLVWSRDIAVFSDGYELSQEGLDQLRAWDIPAYTEKIKRLEGHEGKLQRVILESGQAIQRDSLFFSTGQIKRQRLPEKLGCQITSKGAIETDQRGESRVSGVFCAGDNTESPQLVVVAASEGAKAAIAINKMLTQQDLLAHAR